MNRTLLRLLLAASILLGTAGAQAATPPWPSAPFQYFAKRYAIAKVLGDFATAFGMKLELDPQVQGQVDGDYAAASPSQFLDTLAASYGLTWYYRNGTLFIDRASDATSRTLHVGRGEVDTLKHALESLGIFDARFGWGDFADRGVVIVSGPPSYVKAVAETVDQLGLGPAGNEELRIFTLKHARAEDRTFSYRDQQVTTPGVATILRGLVGGGAPSALGTTTAGLGKAAISGTPATPAAAPLSATGAPRTTDGSADAADHADRGNALAVGPAPAPPSRHVVIEADQRLNAVIVRDTPEHMASYEQLIRQLDVPTPLIEIEAMIVDVNTDKLDSLGVNWAGRKSGITAGFGDVSADPTATTITLAKGTNINQGSLLANTAGFFLSQVNALASRGEARIIGRPSVLTTDNLVAVLDLSQTFYVRTSGERVAQLTPVTTGTLLKVTPRIVDDGGKRMVQLIVDIEDGSVNTDTPVDSLPTVTQSNISTQAVILEDDSLLIGGYILESDSAKRDKVPLLGDIPGIGALFRTDTKTGTRRERMFLIRPRIVRNPADPASGQPLPPVVLPPVPGAPGAVDQAYDRRTDAPPPAAH